METLLVYRPLWAVLISLLAAGLIMLSDKKPNLRETWTILAAVGKLLIVLSMIPSVLVGEVLEVEPIAIAKGISLHLKADATGMVFAVLASFLWVLTSFYSIGYMRRLKEEYQTGYYACFAVCLSATMGIAFAANLITFFIFYEILTIATYPLVVHHCTEESISAGRKYLVYTLLAGQVFLIGILWLQYLVGTGEFRPGGFLTGEVPAGFLQIIFFLLVAGTAVKAGVMPVHGWLPAAMIAPTPVSALLHAVAVVKAGAFAIVRIVGFVFGTELLKELGVAPILAAVAGFTIIVSSLIAMSQDNLKKRLAFSTIGQLSYVVLGTALLTPLSILGALYHIVAHALMKITLFFCAGAIFAKTRITCVSQLKGIGRLMPYTMGAFTIGSVGIIGMPFLVGFISKWNLALGALQQGQGVYVAVLLLSSLLSAGYFLPIVYTAFFQKPDPEIAELHQGEADKLMVAPLLITAAFSLVLGIFPNAGGHLYDLAVLASHNIFHGQIILGGW
ncbi:MAG: monovalent cation/H+ antiporter subunit D family protein [Clostridia bacterium]|nr:monovalent cation/H+ antiporter subunit D family protein [Clostridia bacterium]